MKYVFVNKVKDSGKIVGYNISMQGVNGLTFIKRGDILKLKYSKHECVNGSITSDGRVIADVDVVEVLNKDKKGNDIIFYHGSYTDELFTPVFGGGKNEHDFGNGFYLTRDKNLAAEWACSFSDKDRGFVHTFKLKDASNLKVYDFEKSGLYPWMVELMNNRDIVEATKRYKELSKIFIAMYRDDISKYDIVRGWRADASFALIAQDFVKDNADVSILGDLLRLGNLGIQYVLKSEKSI